MAGGASLESRWLSFAGRRELGVMAIWLIPLLAGDFDFDLGEIFEKKGGLPVIWEGFGEDWEEEDVYRREKLRGNGCDPYSLPCDPSQPLPSQRCSRMC